MNLLFGPSSRVDNLCNVQLDLDGVNSHLRYATRRLVK